MNATHQLHSLGQSLWLDNITREMLNNGKLESYIEQLSVTGLTSNPTIFDHAIGNGSDYDDDIRQKLKDGKSGESLFFELERSLVDRACDRVANLAQTSARRYVLAAQELVDSQSAEPGHGAHVERALLLIRKLVSLEFF